MRKKVAGIVACLSACGILLAACGDVNVTENTIELKKDGKITEYTIEDFSQSYYDAEELNTYIQNTVDTYRESHEGSVRITRSEVQEQKAYLTMKYDSAATYSDFSRRDCFWGTVAEAQAAGYDLDMDYIQVSREEAAGSSSVSEGRIQSVIPFQDVQTDEEMKVFLIKESVSVIVPGTIQYVSADGTKVTGTNTVSVSTDEEAADDNQMICVLYK